MHRVLVTPPGLPLPGSARPRPWLPLPSLGASAARAGASRGMGLGRAELVKLDTAGRRGVVVWTGLAAFAAFFLVLLLVLLELLRCFEQRSAGTERMTATGGCGFGWLVGGGRGHVGEKHNKPNQPRLTSSPCRGTSLARGA